MSMDEDKKEVQFSFKIDRDLQAKFKIKCIQEWQTQQKKLTQLVRDYVGETRTWKDSHVTAAELKQLSDVADEWWNGKIFIEGEYLVLTLPPYDNDPYKIPLSEIQTAEGQLKWVRHLVCKKWITPEALDRIMEKMAK